MTTDRLRNAEQVMYRLSCLRSDANELLRCAPLSLDAAESLDYIIADLRRVAQASRPVVTEDAAE